MLDFILCWVEGFLKVLVDVFMELVDEIIHFACLSLCGSFM